MENFLCDGVECTEGVVQQLPHMEALRRWAPTASPPDLSPTAFLHAVLGYAADAGEAEAGDGSVADCCNGLLDCSDGACFTLVGAVAGQVLFPASKTLAVLEVHRCEPTWAKMLLGAVRTKPFADGRAIAGAFAGTLCGLATGSSCTFAAAFGASASTFAIEPIESADEEAIFIVAIHGFLLALEDLLFVLRLHGVDPTTAAFAVEEDGGCLLRDVILKLEERALWVQRVP